jgi:hypothetical protein
MKTIGVLLILGMIGCGDGSALETVPAELRGTAWSVGIPDTHCERFLTFEDAPTAGVGCYDGTGISSICIVPARYAAFSVREAEADFDGVTYARREIGLDTAALMRGVVPSCP